MKSGLGNGHCVLCRVGAYICAVPVEYVCETMRPLPVEPLAGVPPFIAGVAVVRGIPTPVVDAERLVGGRGSASFGRFVVIRTGERRAVLAVGAVLGVRALTRDSFDDLPPLLRGAGIEAVEGIGALDAHLLVVLEAARIIPDSVWAALGGASAHS